MKFSFILKASLKKLAKLVFKNKETTHKEKTIDTQLSIENSNELKRKAFDNIYRSRLSRDELRSSMIAKIKDPSLIESIKVVEHY